MSETADILWWVFLATTLAVILLIAGLSVAMMRAQQRMVALHRSYLQRLVRAHEEERSRIAREVHDDAVQRLTLIDRELELFDSDGNRLDSADHRHLGGIRGEVHDLADSLRKLAHQLHPAALEHAGLNVALAQLADEMSRAHNVDVRIHLPPTEPPLTSDARLALFRIAQEAVRNAIRHGGATEVHVRLQLQSGSVELRVEDAGVGFDPRATRRRGIGLVGIEERARLVGGSAWVVSVPGAGTQVIARVGATAANA